jgi:NAD(P)-dependent dehydrogenase (short-subunit alcohol dehydrogenase family)
MNEHQAKTFVVTGSNTGIGFETAKALAKTGGRVVLAVRNPGKGDAAAARIKEETGSDRLMVQRLDLADLSSVREAADQLSKAERIDVLVNNAGLASTAKGETKDGFELVVGTNHLGTFALTEALMPKILETARARGEARVVNLSSTAHQFARRLDPHDLFPEKRSRARHAYAESKLMNLLHAREMARRYGRMGVRAHAVHPGFVASDFGRSDHFPGLWQAAFLLTKPMQISPEKGAKTTLAAALSDDGAWNNGLYWDKESPATPSLPEGHEKIARDLWEESKRLLREKGFVTEEPEEEPQAPLGGPSPLFPNAL